MPKKKKKAKSKKKTKVRKKTAVKKKTKVKRKKSKKILKQNEKPAPELVIKTKPEWIKVVWLTKVNTSKNILNL